MIHKVITKIEFKRFADGLIEQNQTFGPKQVDKRADGSAIYQFKDVDSYDDMDLDYTVTYSSVKNFFLPFREELSSFDFSDAYPSPYYMARRTNTFLVGMDHEPLDDCFCESLGHDTAHRGFNLFCTDIGDKYYLTIGSSKAFNFLKNFKVSDPGNDDSAKFHARRKYLRESFKAKVEVAGLPSVLDIEFESPVWKKWGDKCLNCGSCAMVCPTCYCYGIEENIDVSLKCSHKERVEYSCNLYDFAEVAGGHNFRPLKEDRLKYRFYHHYRGFAQNAEDPICVGCNRCGRACLAGINPKDVISDLQMED